MFLHIYFNNTSDPNILLLFLELTDIPSTKRNGHCGHSLVALQVLDPLVVHLCLYFPLDPVHLFVLLVLQLWDLGVQVSLDSLHMGGTGKMFVSNNSIE